MENRRLRGGRTVQKTLLYLGEISDSARVVWCRTIDKLKGEDRLVQLSLFPRDRQPSPMLPAIQVQMDRLELSRPRQWGACWLALRTLGAVGAGEFLARAPAAHPRRHALAQCAQDAGGLPADRSGQRVAVASAVVRSQRDGRSLGRGFRPLAQKDTLYRAWTGCWRTRRRCFRICTSAGRCCSAPATTCCSTT